ncbi:hypothetical protein [Clostridium sp.]|uniref:hypothetical protein n=1 Tax=Clostridium sp. TaxID=1506 RepID=UPI0034638671
MDFVSFEDVIAKIQGVTHSKVVYNDEEVEEVHIIANTIRSPKQIVRDIESALLAIFDYRIDRKLISIAQIDTGETKSIKRIRYEGISLEVKDNNVRCEVRLAMDDDVYMSTETAIGTSINRRRVVAKATVSAVEEMIGQVSAFDVEDIVINSIRDISYVTVIVNMINDVAEEVLIGTAIVRNDMNEAIAKATLDAINRRIEK